MSTDLTEKVVCTTCAGDGLVEQRGLVVPCTSCGGKGFNRVAVFDLTAAMCRESTEGWDGRPDGPDRCTCGNRKPVPYNAGYCANCDGWIPDDDEPVEFDMVADAAQYRDERDER